MKKRLTYFLTGRRGVLLLLLSVFMKLNAQEMTVNGILYKVLSSDNLTVEVTAGQNPGSCGTNVTIPSTISYESKTWTVTAIGDGAFSVYSPESLLSVALPTSIVKIGNGAFSGCRNLSSVTGAGAVVEIGHNAFKGCSSLSRPYFSSEIRTIGDYAFMGCTSFDFASIGEEIESLGRGVYKNCTGIEGLYIGHSIQIPDEFCYGCTNLSSIRYEESYTRVSAVGAYAFYNCGKLTSLRTTSNCQFGEFAFANCTNLSDVISTTSSIGQSAFMNCENIKRANLGAGDIGSSAFSGSGISEVWSSASNIGWGAFSYCANLTTATLTRVNEIPGDIFSGCSVLSSITLPNNYTSIGSNAFYGCELIETFEVPQTVTSIGNYAFNGCASLTQVVFKGSMPELGSMASTILFDCPLLTDIYYPAFDNSYYLSPIMQTGRVSYGSDIQRGLHPQIILKNEWNSYCATASYKVPDGIEAYVVKSCGGSSVKLKKVTTINQGEGLLLKPEQANTVYEAIRIADAEAYSNNMLVGVTTATDLSTPEDGYTNFILYNGEFRKTTGTLQAFKAYLPLPSTLVANSRMLQIVIDDETTGISTMLKESEHDVWYDMQGCRYTSRPSKKGIYILNGKKYVHN